MKMEERAPRARSDTVAVNVHQTSQCYAVRFCQGASCVWDFSIPLYQTKSSAKITELWLPVPLVMSMKTYYWFNRNLLPSYLHMATAGAFIAPPSHLRSSLTGSRRQTGFLIVLLLLFCFGLLPAVHAQTPTPTPDGGYPGGNTAEGEKALFSRLASRTPPPTGLFNTAVGWKSLYTVTNGGYNTGLGAGTLIFNTGSNNTAVGTDALFTNNVGTDNTATGFQALFNNTSGILNTADGEFALFHNVHGGGNTALGLQALFHNSFGDNNTAVGVGALLNSGTGSNNIGLGQSAGYNVTTASNVICIGNLVPGANVPNSCYIGNIWDQAPGFPSSPVYVDLNGKLGTNASAKRFKKNIKPMDSASEAILALKPVTFHYKSDHTNTEQFGLIAEEVAEVNPDLVVRDKDGKIYSVRYDQVNAMLLNEFLKEHKRFVEEQHKVEKLEATMAQQQKAMEALAAGMKKQAAQIQKVSTELELGTPAQRTVLNNQ